MPNGVDLYTALTGFPLDRVVVVDTETTGTRPFSGDEILSIAICDGAGEPLFSSLIRPTKHTSWQDAERINHISPAMVEKSPTLDEVAEQLRKILLGDRLIVGYNVRFDITFLVEGKVLEPWPGSTFDVMREYASVHGSTRSMYGNGYMFSKLAACADSYGYEFAAHEAMEDAIATAYCFRALICDEAYIRARMKKRFEYLKRFSVTQTKATTENIISLVNCGMASSENAELRLGEVTRGKSKGSPRYECFVDDRCVGVSPPASVSHIRKYCALGDEVPLPKIIPCRVLLKNNGENASCEITITDQDRVLDEALITAELIRSQSGFTFRGVKSSKLRQPSPMKECSPSATSNSAHITQVEALRESPSTKTVDNRPSCVPTSQDNVSGSGWEGCFIVILLILGLFLVLMFVVAGLLAG